MRSNAHFVLFCSSFATLSEKAPSMRGEFRLSEVSFDFVPLELDFFRFFDFALSSFAERRFFRA